LHDDAQPATVWATHSHRHQEPIDRVLAWAALEAENAEWRKKRYVSQAAKWEASALEEEQAARVQKEEEELSRKAFLKGLEAFVVPGVPVPIWKSVQDELLPSGDLLCHCGAPAAYGIRGRWVCFNHIMEAYSLPRFDGRDSQTVRQSDSPTVPTV
jgi:hypothetical protein